MKIKQKVDIVIDSFLVVIGMLIIVLAKLNYNDVKLLFIGTMISYAVLNLLQFLLTRKSKDYEGLYTFIASMVVGIVGIYFSFDKENVLSVSIMSWVTMMAVIKFIKTDYYNDRRDRMWKLRVVTLVLFMLVGILTSISLNYSTNVQVLVIGFFFLIHGILELIDPITKYLLSR